MTEPVSSTLAPLVPLGILGGAGLAAGVDAEAVIAAFGGALLFSFMAKNISLAHRVLGLVSAGIFGYYAGAEIVKRKFLGFESLPIPTYVCAFFGVVVFRLLLELFNDEARAWVRKKLGLNEGAKGD
jgi:hypothetical protein